jgi:hypothetical protein
MQSRTVMPVRSLHELSDMQDLRHPDIATLIRATGLPLQSPYKWCRPCPHLKWHATRCPGALAFSFGTSRLQISCARGQRVRK